MRALLSLAFLPLLYSPAHSQALTGDQIKANFFNGKPFVANSTTRQRFTMVFTPDGEECFDVVREGAARDAEAIGIAAADVLLERGAGAIVQRVV